MKIKYFEKTCFYQVKSLEPFTANLWEAQGTITPIWCGDENTYYVNEFGQEFYCKNYPNLYGEVTS